MINDTLAPASVLPSGLSPIHTGRGKLVQAPPSSGKTTLVRNHRFVVDVDQLVFDLTGQKHSKATSDRFFSTGEYSIIGEAVELLLSQNISVVSNVDPFTAFGLRADLAFTYGDMYVEHIKQSGRDDLLSNFSEDELLSWMDGYGKNAKRVYKLQPGQYLAAYMFAT